MIEYACDACGAKNNLISLRDIHEGWYEYDYLDTDRELCIKCLAAKLDRMIKNGFHYVGVWGALRYNGPIYDEDE